jgi:hypothetical protein
MGSWSGFYERGNEDVAEYADGMVLVTGRQPTGELVPEGRKAASPQEDRNEGPHLLKFVVEESLFFESEPAPFEVDNRLSFERVIPVDRAILPLLWIDGGDSRLLQPLTSSSAILSADFLGRFQGRSLFKIVWKGELRGWIDALVDSGIYLIAIESLEGSCRWDCSAWVYGSDTVSDFYQNLTSCGLEITIESLTRQMR